MSSSSSSFSGSSTSANSSTGPGSSSSGSHILHRGYDVTSLSPDQLLGVQMAFQAWRFSGEYAPSREELRRQRKIQNTAVTYATALGGLTFLGCGRTFRVSGASPWTVIPAAAAAFGTLAISSQLQWSSWIRNVLAKDAPPGACWATKVHELFDQLQRGEDVVVDAGKAGRVAISPRTNRERQSHRGTTGGAFGGYGVPPAQQGQAGGASEQYSDGDSAGFDGGQAQSQVSRRGAGPSRSSVDDSQFSSEFFVEEATAGPAIGSVKSDEFLPEMGPRGGSSSKSTSSTSSLSGQRKSAGGSMMEDLDWFISGDSVGSPSERDFNRLDQQQGRLDGQKQHSRDAMKRATRTTSPALHAARQEQENENYSVEAAQRNDPWASSWGRDGTDYLDEDRRTGSSGGATTRQPQTSAGAPGGTNTRPAVAAPQYRSWDEIRKENVGTSANSQYRTWDEIRQNS